MVADTGNDEQDPVEGSRPHGGLSPNQERAIIALLNEQTIGRAAAAVDVSQRTLYRWLDKPVFARA